MYISAYSTAISDATPSSTAPVPAVGGSDDTEDIQDLSSANAVIQQQQNQIQSSAPAEAPVAVSE